MKNISKALSIIVFVISVVVYSCIDKDYDFDRISTDIQWDPKLALTIGTMNINIEDLLNSYSSDSVLIKNPDGSMTIVYEKPLESYTAEQKITLPEQIPFVIPGMIFPNIMPVSGEVSRDTSFTIPVIFSADQMIDSLKLKVFSLSASGYSTFSNNLSQMITITFTRMNKDTIIGGTRQRLTYFEDIPVQNNNINYTTSARTNAYNYMLKFSNVQYGSSETNVNIKLTLRGTPGTPINPLSSVNVTLRINEIRYRLMYGYIGQPELLNAYSSMDVSIFSRDMSKNIEWKDPRTVLYCSSSYVVPADIFIQGLWVRSMNDVEFDVSPDNSQTQNPKDMKYPTKIGQVENDSVVMSKPAYSLFYNALETKSPKEIIYRIISRANPHGQGTQYNIISDTSVVRGKLVFTLPVWFRSSGFGYTDTMDFNLSNMGSDNNNDNNNDESNYSVKLKNLLFRTVTSNELPINMRLQVYFADENYTILDSLYTKESNSYIIKSGKVDEVTGKVTAPYIWKNDAILSENQIKRIENAKFIIYKVTYNTYDYDNTKPYVKVFTDNKLKIIFAVKIQPEVTVTNNKN